MGLSVYCMQSAALEGRSVLENWSSSLEHSSLESSCSCAWEKQKEWGKYKALSQLVVCSKEPECAQGCSPSCFTSASYRHCFQFASSWRDRLCCWPRGCVHGGRHQSPALCFLLTHSALRSVPVPFSHSQERGPWHSFYQYIMLAYNLVSSLFSYSAYIFKSFERYFIIFDLSHKIFLKIHVMQKDC